MYKYVNMYVYIEVLAHMCDAFLHAVLENDFLKL